MATRILIADDSLTIQKAFAMTFGGEDVTLLAARSADEGLTMARQNHPELVIADAVMPGRSGYELCAAIKADPTLRGVPVYILASSQNPYDEARGKQSGVDGQFTKPFESIVLVERVKDAIAKGATATSAAEPVARPPLAVVPSAAPSARSAPAPRSMTPPGGIDDDYGEITINPVTGGPVLRPSVPAPLAASAPPASDVTPPPKIPLGPIHPPVAPFSPVTPGLPALVPAAAAATHVPTAASNTSSPGLRPSLIPGLRPGAVPTARPGAAALRPPSLPGSTMVPAAVGHPPASALTPAAASPPSHGVAPIPGQRGPVPSMPQVSSGPARTLVGLPAASAQLPQRFGAPAAPARPPTQPVRPLEAPRTPVPVASVPPMAVNPAGSSAITSKIDRVDKVDKDRIDRFESKIDQKIAAIAAKGPEYEALAKLSREIIEKIVWEIVPELVEVIVREELQKRGRI